MSKEYRVKNRGAQYLALYISFLFVVMLKGVLVPEEYEAESILYLSVVAALFAVVTAFFVCAIWNMNKKITTDYRGIVIDRPFRRIELKWDEIAEFGRTEKGYGTVGGWRYYLKSQDRAKQIIFADSTLDNLDDLISTIFENAKKSRFIQISNEAEMPFAKDWHIERWK